MRTVIVFALLAAAVLTFGHYFSHDVEYLAYYRPDYFMRAIFGILLGGMVGVASAGTLSVFVGSEEESQEVVRLAALEGEICGRSTGTRFVVGGRKVRGGAREYFYSRVNADGTRELCSREVCGTQVLEDPELKDEGVYTIVRNRLKTKHRLAGWALNLHGEKHILRVPVGTVMMNFEVQ